MYVNSNKELVLFIDFGLNISLKVFCYICSLRMKKYLLILPEIVSSDSSSCSLPVLLNPLCGLQTTSPLFRRAEGEVFVVLFWGNDTASK